MKTTDSAPHNYILPYNVNYRAPFKFVTGDCGGTLYTYTNTKQDVVIISWVSAAGDVESSYDYSLEQTKRYVTDGRWLVLDEQPASFRFTCKNMPTVYIYDPLLGMCAEGSDWYTPCAQQTARDAITNGVWTLLPSEHTNNAANVLSTQTEAEAESAAFSATNSLVKPASKASTNGLLEIIKNACITSKGRIAVTVYPDHYEVYHRPLFEDCLSVDEKDLEEFLTSLVVIDRSGNWEY